MAMLYKNVISVIVHAVDVSDLSKINVLCVPM